MANQKQLAILRQGVNAWNFWRQQNADQYIDLDWADLKELDLKGANLSNATMVSANLENANLSGSSIGGDLENANLARAKLVEANLYGKLYGANLQMAVLNRANIRVDLSQADLSQADLSGAVLRETRLWKADFSEVKLGDTVFGDIDLSTVKRLETVKHHGPSYISVGTLYASKGNIPEIFLRRAGVPENLITYMHSLTGKAFDFYSCFISHSSIDKSFCERLYADLQARAVRTWYFPEDAKWGESVWGEIDHNMKLYDKLVVVCSESSLQSGPVQREIERALIREDREHKNILFPIRIDEYLFERWEHPRKADLLAKVVGNFCNWDTEVARYNRAFEKLLEGLQAANS